MGNGKIHIGNQRLRNAKYPRSVMDEARRLYIKGYSPDKIARLPHMPSSVTTIHDWKVKEGWREERNLIFIRAKELRIEKTAQKFSDMDIRQMELLFDLSEEVRKSIHGNYLLMPQDLNYLAMAVDKIIKNERLIDDKVTERQETNVKFGWEEILYETITVEKQTIIDMPVEDT